MTRSPSTTPREGGAEGPAATEPVVPDGGTSQEVAPEARALRWRPEVVVPIWIVAVLVLDALPWPGTPARGLNGPELVKQGVFGAVTWWLLVALLRRQPLLIRVQTGVVVALATLIEYTFSPLLEAYVYRIGTVPLFVPPGHGLVYLAAACLGNAAWVRRHARAAVAVTVAVGGAWAVAGLALGSRRDDLGAFWFACLLGFLLWGRSRLLYVGAFAVVSWLEIWGTALGTWAWAPHDPVLGVIGQGNPPSGAAGGYGWFDLYALLLAPVLIRWWRRLRRKPSGGAEAGEDGVVQEPVGGGGVATAAPVDTRQ
ncbi:MAG: hypothetical protein U0Q15_18055 [Kineosporiaceae bacterium]